MKIQKLQFALTTLHNLRKNNKQIIKKTNNNNNNNNNENYKPSNSDSKGKQKKANPDI